MNLQQHPVSPEMRDKILVELKRIEEFHNVKIIYACESGSRGWGFASTNSDYDVRFIYVNHPKHYIRVDNNKSENIEHIVDDKLDICGWSITKTLGLIYKSNPTFLEWIQSPIVYLETEDMNELKEIARSHFIHISGYEHYMAMARGTKLEWFKDNTTTAIMKKYFYAIRPILAAMWIKQKLEIPPMVFQDLLPILDNQSVLKAIEDLVEIKRSATEKQMIPRINSLDTFIDEMIIYPDHPKFPKYERPSIFDLSDFAWNITKKYSSDLKEILVIKEEGDWVVKNNSISKQVFTPAIWNIFTPEQETFWNKWVTERPQCIQDIIRKHNLRPDYVYKMNTNDIVRLYSFHEDGTVTISVDSRLNPRNPLTAVFERNVFGVDPATLTLLSSEEYKGIKLDGDGKEHLPDN